MAKHSEQNNQTPDQVESRQVRVTAPPENWAAFDEWMYSRGCANLAEGFRCLMQEVVSKDIQGDSDV